MTFAVYPRIATASLVAGLLAGCSGFPLGQTPPDTFDLTAPPRVHAPTSGKRQLLIPEPTALKALTSNNIVVRTSPSSIQYLSDSQWTDQLPNIVQSRLVQAYEDSGRFGGVGRPGDGLAIDYRVLADIRTFEVSTVGAAVARVDISIKILDDRNGVVRARRDFKATAPVSGDGNAAFVDALDRAFNKDLAEIVIWTLTQV